MLRLATWISQAATRSATSPRSVASITARGRRPGLAHDDAGNAPAPLDKLGKHTWRAPARARRARRGARRARARGVGARGLARPRSCVLQRHEACSRTCRGARGEPREPCGSSGPTHEEGSRWRVATTLEAVDVDADGFGEYRAADFDELIDHTPSRWGTWRASRSRACGVPHEIVFAGRRRALRPRATGLGSRARVRGAHPLLRGARADAALPLPGRAVRARLRRARAPRLDRAWWRPRDSLPARPLPGDADPGDGEPERDDAYVTFLGLCSHEYFHTWNVQAHPARPLRALRPVGRVVHAPAVVLRGRDELNYTMISRSCARG